MQLGVWWNHAAAAEYYAGEGPLTTQDFGPAEGHRCVGTCFECSAFGFRVYNEIVLDRAVSNNHGT